MGMRAEGVESVMRMKRVPLADRAQLFEDIQVMAAASARVFNRKKADD